MSNYLLGRVSQRVLEALRAEMFAKMLRWPADAYQKNSAGEITSKFIFEANFALGSAAKSAVTLVRDTLQCVFLTVVLFVGNWRLALMSLVFAPFLAMLIRYLIKLPGRVLARSQSSVGGLLADVEEAYSLNRLIKLSNGYPTVEGRFGRLNDELKDLMVSFAKMSALGNPAAQLLCMSAVAVVLAAAMFESQAGLLSMGEFVTFLAALLLLMPPIRHLTGLATSVTMMKVAADSLFGMLDMPEEQETGAEELRDRIATVEFENVTLRYAGAERDAVKNLSVKAKTGGFIALVGPSGSGKSSVVNLLPRFREPTSGRILVNGRDVREFTLGSLRRQIAVVSQDAEILEGTLRENITYGTQGVTDGEIMRAVRDASLMELIESLPQGLDTPAGEAGEKLSGGERQRIAIARAFLKDAPVLILDEATSALDAQSEKRIKAALQRLMKGRITFAVAHRFSTIESATEILTMKDGEVVERGTWRELAMKKGLFAELCRLQGIDPARVGFKGLFQIPGGAR